MFDHFGGPIYQTGCFYLAILQVPKAKMCIFPRLCAPFSHPSCPEVAGKGVKKVVFSELFKKDPPAGSKST